MDSLTVIVQHALGMYPGTQRELARRAGLPWATLSAVVGGRRTASPAVARKIVVGLLAMSEQYKHMSEKSLKAGQYIDGQVRTLRP